MTTRIRAPALHHGAIFSYPSGPALCSCDNAVVHAAAACFDLHVPESRSLKTKRAAIRPIVDGLRHRFPVSVAEVDHQNQWQRAAIGVAVVGSSATQVREVLASVERFVVSAPDVELLDVETEWFEQP
jgi:uncharacterized protein YlxP (DUF503 family)